jgi:pimeloyl-ACP methyl ester carboxylesterase
MSSIVRVLRASKRVLNLATFVVLSGAFAVSATTLGSGCLVSNVIAAADGGPGTGAGGEGGPAGDSSVAGDDPSKNEANKDAIPYRDLAGHPGCTTAGLDARAASAYVPATIPGYKCAAKAYPLVNEDTKKPIVLLIHGNSSTPADWEKFPADKADALPMLADRLSAQGFRVLAVDVRYDKSDDPTGNNKTENAGQNFDHGWAVPIVQHFIESVMAAFPDRQLSLVGFSVAPTVARDALRRLHRAGKKPYEHFKDLVFAAGSHHGVSSFRALCGSNPTMRGKIACELGDRTSFTPTVFLAPNNGPSGAWETPCADGDSAFGQRGVCGGHKVTYTTVVMKDIKEGTYQDEFVSEGSAKLTGATNLTVELSDIDQSNYFYNGLFKNHMGSIRSDAALKIIVKALGGTQ